MIFADLGLEPKLLQALSEAGYEEPTPIQEAAIPEALKGRDVLGIAQTGTGKTASFTLPMIQRLAQGRAKARMPRSLVLAPTRELAAQVAENFEKYGKYHKLTMALLIGGVSFGDQDAKLSRGVDVLIATPGRLLDHHERGKLLLNGVQIMVVDEADRMLDMGFIPDIERIFNLTPFTRQTLFFSATMPPEIQRLTDKFLQAPVQVEVSRPATTASTIAQHIIRMPSNNDKLKRDTLRKLVNDSGVKNGIIFCNRKKTVDIVAASLQKHGHNARPIHGDLAQSYRTETLNGFRDGSIELLVASDVAARGLDIPDVSHVFNFDTPIHSDDYVHRIGRTGRAGRSGTAYMLVSPSDSKFYEAILATTGSEGIDEVDMAEFFATFSEEELAGSRSSGRGRERNSRSRNNNSSKRERPTRKSTKKADVSDQPEMVETAADIDDSPEIAHSTAEHTQVERARPERNSASAAPVRRQSRRDREEAVEDSKIIGFGDHVPAFFETATRRESAISQA